ncbi:MAG TPA: hypothetical protein VLF87_02745 [Patescibacteria group bacterium]|nr:hypothetical protein [Patescibacteria group bacterium]
MGKREEIAQWGHQFADQALRSRQAYNELLAGDARMGADQGVSNLVMRAIHGLHVGVALRLEEFTTPEPEVRAVQEYRGTTQSNNEGVK